MEKFLKVRNVVTAAIIFIAIIIVVIFLFKS